MSLSDWEGKDFADLTKENIIECLEWYCTFAIKLGERVEKLEKLALCDDECIWCAGREELDE